MKLIYKVAGGLLLSFLLTASAPQVSLSATHNLAYIGDRIGVTLLVKADGQFDPQTVVLDNQGQKFELISEGRLEKRIVPEGVVWEQKYELAFFDLGDFIIGPARVTYNDHVVQAGELSSNEVPIKIKGLVSDAAQELEPGKRPLELSGSPAYLLKKVWLPMLLMACLLVLIILLTRKKKPLPPVVSSLSPVQWLESELKKLGDERLLEKGFQILFALRLTHVLKVFIRQFYRIDAEEMTTEELLARLDGHLPAPTAEDAIKKILQAADLVKFARYEMTLSEQEVLGRNTRQFTEIHRREEQKRQEVAMKGDERHV